MWAFAKKVYDGKMIQNNYNHRIFFLVQLYSWLIKNFITVSTGSCLNTRDKGLGIRDKANTCVDQLELRFAARNINNMKSLSELP